MIKSIMAAIHRYLQRLALADESKMWDRWNEEQKRRRDSLEKTANGP